MTDFEKEEIAAVQRAIGRLEGQFQSDRARQANFESTINRQVENIATQIMGIRTTLGEIESGAIRDRTSVHSVARTVAYIIGGAAGTVVFIITVIQFVLRLME